LKSYNPRLIVLLLALSLASLSPVCFARGQAAAGVTVAYVDGAAAKLSIAQVQKLLLLRAPIAVPTYVPAGFRVSDVSTRRDTKTSPGFVIIDYHITYAGPGGKSFSIDSANEGIGDVMLSEKTIKGSNPFFENGVEVGFVDDEESGPGPKAVASQWVSSRRQYQLRKTEAGTQMYHLESSGITQREALKIMESLRYLKR
jgi:hypothetical protein